MKLLVGLGNPEKKYDGTYHNMGFFVLDKFAEKFNVDFDKKKHNCKLAFLETNDDIIMLAKPLTYMNLSGNAVLELKKKYNLNDNNRYKGINIEEFNKEVEDLLKRVK